MRFSFTSIPLVVAFVLSRTSSVTGQNETTPAKPELFLEGCDVDAYYSSLLADSSDPTQWTKESLMKLVMDTHRNILPTVGPQVGDDDVYNAIIDLDPGSKNGTVLLIYRNTEMNDFPNANPLYWDVERLWPMARGYNTFSPAFTDVHQVRPADSTVLLLKGILSFGMCDTVEFLDACVVPANSETANDTAQDGKIWTPPEFFRGEIARALMYMDLRYEQLSLQDCGPFYNFGMGYLSQMLQWHMDYPPTEREIRRNNRSCERWQGNRNPFVDYPELATALYGEPEEIMEGTRTYPKCIENFPTSSPTATPNECGNIAPGDVPVFLVNMDDPDEVVFLPLFDLPGGIELFITDQAWNGTHLLEGVENEGTNVLMTPEEGIPQGILFGYGPSINLGDMWEVESGSFSLGTEEGDNVFLYCIDADDKIHFLAGFSNYGNWSDPGLSAEEYGEASSSLPFKLTSAAIVLPHYDNYFYNGSRDDTLELLRADMLSPSTWVGDDENRFGVMAEGDTSGAWAASVTSAAVLLLNSLLAVLL